VQRCANIFPDVFFCVCRAAFDAGCAIQPREEWGILLQECARGPHGCSIHCPGEIHGRSTASKSASFHEALPFFAAHANHNCHQMKRCPKPQKDDDVLYVYVYKYHQIRRVRRGTTVDCSTLSLSLSLSLTRIPPYFAARYVRFAPNQRCFSARYHQFSPKGNLLASGSFDKTVRVWNIEGGDVQALEGHSLNVSTLSWPSNTILASGGNFHARAHVRMCASIE